MTDSPTPPTSPMPSCAHLGQQTGTRLCPDCRGRVERKVYACPKRESTTLNECDRCPHHTSAERLLLRSVMAAGDAAVLTAAVRDLHRCYPKRFRVAVEVGGNAEVFNGNPCVHPLSDLDGPRILEVGYPLVNRSNQCGKHFLNGYIDGPPDHKEGKHALNQHLGLSIKLTEFRPHIRLMPSERSPIEKPYWVCVSGGKPDYASKVWPFRRWQMLVNMLSSRVRFVQVGHVEHGHRPIRDAIDLRGRTTLRELIRLIAFADGVICPVTGIMHFAAAFNRPCVVIAYGGEPRAWEAYDAPNRLANAPDDLNKAFVPHDYLTVQGSMDCCKTGGCWRSKVTTGQFRERCLHLRNEEGELFPECLASITPVQVADAVASHLPAPTAVQVNAPRLHVLANMGCLGGGEHSTVTLLAGLAKRGPVDFWPLTPVNEAWEVPLYQSGARIHPPTDQFRLSPGDDALFYMNDYPNHLCAQSDFWREALSAARSVQLVLNYVVGRMHTQTWLADRLTRVYFLNSTKADEWRKLVASNGLAKASVHVLPPPVDLSPFFDLKPQPHDGIIISRLGGSAVKLPDDAAAFYSKLSSRLPTASFWFMPGPPSLEAAAHGNPAFNVLNRNQLPVRDFLSFADLFCYPVHPRVHDQGPRVVMEAMASGVPCVCENRDGPRDRIVNGVDGLLAQSLDELADLTVKLAQDASLRSQLGQAAREKARQWSVQSWLDLVTNGRSP